MKEPIQILKWPDQRLREKCKPCIINDVLREKLAEIEEFIKTIPPHLGNFIGLAAPQVGITERFFMVMGTWYINPEIIWTPKAPLKDFKEGCYSLQDQVFAYETQRHYSVSVKYQDPQGEWHEARLKGLEAQAFQHEFDHLNGILACDHKK